MSLLQSRFVLALATVLCLVVSDASAQDATLQTGRWSAFVATNGGRLPFFIDIAGSPGEYTAHVVNGEERVDVPVVRVEGMTATLEWDHYDARIIATVYENGGAIKGSYFKTRSSEVAELPFMARLGETPRFEPAPSQADIKIAESRFNERWRLEFGDGTLAMVDFESDENGAVSASIQTPTGDYRYLVGSFARNRLKLSTFDGAHAFLLDARMKSVPISDPLRPDLSHTFQLEGRFFSGRHYQDTWTARPDPFVELENPYLLAQPVDGVDLDSLEFLDLDGSTVTLGDERFAGKARIIELFGTWCPNCFDATRVLKDLHERYADQGLAITALGFEVTGDTERDLEQLRKYRDRMEVPYPMLLAGNSSKTEAQQRFPAIDEVVAYPTFVFVDASGTIRWVYSGFSGPGTGQAYVDLRRDLFSKVELLLGID